MEKALKKLAKQLHDFDEASLMALWEEYQAIVEDFQPTRAWEEAVLILGMIQTVRWKNQLFNYHWGQAQHPEPAPRSGSKDSSPGPSPGDQVSQRGKVLRFRTRKDDEPV